MRAWLRRSGGVPPPKVKEAFPPLDRTRGGDAADTFGDGDLAATTARLFRAVVLSLFLPLVALADPTLTITSAGNGTLPGNYTTSHVFVDEVAGETVPLTISYHPDDTSATDVQVFTNLNRRDKATLPYIDSHGIATEEGIHPPSGDVVGDNDAHYYRAYPMGGTGPFTLTLNAAKTGAYRLTARYKQNGTGSWIYYSSSGRRDHAVVVSPRTARDMVMYELNTLTIDSEGTQESQRSTFVDLWDGPGAKPLTNLTRWNLDYAKTLGVNWLWFQPIHPQGIDGRQLDPVTGLPFEVGSPYAVKNFFEVMPLMAKENTRAAAMVEFQNFVSAADTAGVNVMLDAPYNHTAYDAELADSGVFYFSPGSLASAEIRNTESRVFSRDSNGFAPDLEDYCQRAFSAGSIAVAPDRGDFGKFGDTFDVYYGSYSALVCRNPEDNNAFNNEQDVYQYGDANWTSIDRVINGQNANITRNVWSYFSDYILYWLDRTGCPAGTSLADQTTRGIDGLRADFGQGLPPQAWEYIINKARSRKWSFVFMAESLDGGAVTYRSARHFDVLNESITFALAGASQSSDYRSIFESRRAAYGQALVLLNTTSHDEENYVDPFAALIRYSVTSTNDGVPLIFYGQEVGISRTFGFDRYETNFGKQIAHFKKFNSLQPILAPVNRTFALDQLYEVYAALGQARRFSPALRSPNRFFLDGNPKLFGVAKYASAGASPAISDAVLAFANLDRNSTQSEVFKINSTLADLLGLKADRTYNVRNIAAYLPPGGSQPNRRNVYQWPGNLSRHQLADDGFFVSMNPVPTSNDGWSSAPFEAQYLKLYDVTPPPAPNAPTTPRAYSIGNQVTFTWTPNNGPDDHVPTYTVAIGTTAGGSDVFSGSVSGTSYTSTGAAGQTLYATVTPVSAAGITGAPSAASAGTILLPPTGDEDGDGQSNASEDLARTNPLDPKALFRIVTITRNAGGDVTLVWTSVPGLSYVVESTTDLTSAFGSPSPAITADSSTTTFTELGVSAAQKFYRVRVAP